jgi:hypothetical protein
MFLCRNVTDGSYSEKDNRFLKKLLFKMVDYQIEVEYMTIEKPP